jgi:hypothetical protein
MDPSRYTSHSSHEEKRAPCPYNKMCNWPKEKKEKNIFKTVTPTCANKSRVNSSLEPQKINERTLGRCYYFDVQYRLTLYCLLEFTCYD